MFKFLLERWFKLVIISLTLVLCLFTYIFHIEPGWVDIVPLTIAMPHLDAAFEGTRIVQISDIHIDGDWMTTKRLQQIVRQVEQQHPDLVMITGDLVDHDPRTYASGLLKPFTYLTERVPTFAVLGNHDHYSNPQPLQDILVQSHVTELANAVYTITKGGAQLNIAGVDDVWMGRDRLDLVLEQLPQEGAAILLVHEPDFADKAALTNRFDLALSGHSHGGQVRIPFSGPPVLPKHGQRYPVGQYQVGTMVQYTNRGIGMARPRVRFNSRPEITVITLKQAV
ncbi:MAG: metallophosphoesterase [Merismopedia sp. SIO2A8]|nr:metallophosphoesterase [Merismopedia sp. SIO2A8]